MKKGKKSKYIIYMQNLKAQDKIIELEIERKGDRENRYG